MKTKMKSFYERQSGKEKSSAAEELKRETTPAVTQYPANIKLVRNIDTQTENVFSEPISITNEDGRDCEYIKDYKHSDEDWYDDYYVFSLSCKNSIIVQDDDYGSLFKRLFMQWPSPEDSLHIWLLHNNDSFWDTFWTSRTFDELEEDFEYRMLCCDHTIFTDDERKLILLMILLNSELYVPIHDDNQEGKLYLLDDPRYNHGQYLPAYSSQKHVPEFILQRTDVKIVKIAFLDCLRKAFSDLRVEYISLDDIYQLNAEEANSILIIDEIERSRRPAGDSTEFPKGFDSREKQIQNLRNRSDGHFWIDLLSLEGIDLTKKKKIIVQYLEYCMNQKVKKGRAAFTLSLYNDDCVLYWWFDRSAALKKSK